MYNCIRSMKKVLIVFNHPAPYKVRLFNELAKHFDLHVIFERSSASDRNKKFYFEKEYDFKIHKIKGIKIGKENFISNQIVKHLKNNSYDLIIMNGYSQFAEMKAIRYLKMQNISYVLYINGGTIKEKEPKLKYKIKKYFISGAKYYLSPDEESNKYLIHYGAEKDKIFNYPYSTIYEKEILREKPNKDENKKKLGIKYDKVFVSSGQLIKRKNYFSLVKEWKNMPKNYGLYIFGDGKEKNKIAKFVKREKLENVILKGFTSHKEMFEFYKASDAFLFPSKQDIYGHVVNEALSQGVPIISSKNVNSSLHLIKENENGFLLNKFDSRSMLETIEKLSQKESFNNCINTAKKNTIELMRDAHVDIIKGALK